MNGIQLIDFDMAVDVRKDPSGKISDGLVIGDILRQNQALILRLHKGELKSDPSVGAGISDMLLDHNVMIWKKEIREQMELDGQKVSSVVITETDIMIDSRYSDE